MGEIIKVNFSPDEPGKKRGRIEDESSVPEEVEKNDEPHLSKREASISTLLSCKEKYIEMQRFLNGLFGKISAKSIAEAVEIVKDYSDAELRDTINSSSEEKWSAKPGFYEAVSSEYHTRIMHPPKD